MSAIIPYLVVPLLVLLLGALVTIHTLRVNRTERRAPIMGGGSDWQPTFREGAPRPVAPSPRKHKG